MSSFRIYLSAVLLGLCLNAPLLLAGEPPSSADVQRNLDGLADRKLPEAEQKALQKTYEQTLGFLEQADSSKKALTQLKAQLAAAPRQINEAQRELSRLKSSPEVPIAERHARTSLAQLEQLLTDRSNQLTEWNKAIIEANSLVITAQTRPERAQAEISQNQARSQLINDALKSGRYDGKTLTPERRDQLNAELALLAAQTQLRRQELAGNSMVHDHRFLLHFKGAQIYLLTTSRGPATAHNLLLAATYSNAFILRSRQPQGT